ncbi:unnamed protein product [Didymodactylos carnosus]|uniref:Sulfide:quinone oxidoreductase, mitochondrial n=1 Tax=Didymodactylos carnosus TaxID=1234261 RepID=A0A8S2QAD7_9BILA|nr:unnamed protein product [Didymodactylos carnosus]CAF4092947.1 unnamed protein product [Didymodactylos carnosus]
MLQTVYKIIYRRFSTSGDHYKLVVVGAGCGGLACASRFANKLEKNQIAIIDKNDVHVYQPGWTLAGAGLKTVDELERPQKDCIPQNAHWIQSDAVGFEPEKNLVKLDNGGKIKGAIDALENDSKHVVTIYSRKYVRNVYDSIKSFQGGTAIFTFPNSTIKCPGAPQKIMYLAEDLFRKNNVREKSTVIYNTSLPVIFAVKKYAAALMDIVKKRNIQLNTRLNLVEVKSKTKEAIFENLDKPGTFQTFQYDLLHIGAPMQPREVIAKAPIADANGYVDVEKETLQHKKYRNIFAIGDCTNLPTSKTAAAIAASNKILCDNLSNLMDGKTTNVPKVGDIFSKHCSLGLHYANNYDYF